MNLYPATYCDTHGSEMATIANDSETLRPRPQNTTGSMPPHRLPQSVVCLLTSIYKCAQFAVSPDSARVLPLVYFRSRCSDRVVPIDGEPGQSDAPLTTCFSARLPECVASSRPQFSVHSSPRTHQTLTTAPVTLTHPSPIMLRFSWFQLPAA